MTIDDILVVGISVIASLCIGLFGLMTTIIIFLDKEEKDNEDRQE